MCAVEWELLAPLSVEERRAVFAVAVSRRFRKGDILFHEGDPGDSIHLIVEGRVAARSTTPTGESVTFAVVGPGEMIGELAVLGAAARRTLTVVALEPVYSLALRREVFDSLRQRHPAIDRALIAMLAARVEALSDRLREALFVPADKRVIRQLVGLVEQYGTRNGAVHIPLTQADIAHMAGTTRPTANRVLRGLVADGVVRLRRGRIEIANVPALRTTSR
jgi:CRP-like cAMP-binding protein